jgi:hypothetical protein
LVKEQRGKYRNQNHPEDSQKIRNSNDARGHSEVSKPKARSLATGRC